MLKKVVIIGPESTGKSTLCKQLSEYFKTTWAPEYAREYLETNGTTYEFENLYTIAEGQIDSEEKAASEIQRSAFDDQILFIDTDMYVIKVWSEFVFNKCDNRVLTKIANRKYDLYLLCNNDIPWVKDNLREYPDLETRKQLFHHYKDAMVNQHVPWIEISGNYDQRLQEAIEAVQQYCLNSN